MSDDSSNASRLFHVVGPCIAITSIEYSVNKLKLMYEYVLQFDIRKLITKAQVIDCNEESRRCVFHTRINELNNSCWLLFLRSSDRCHQHCITRIQTSES